jgi:hypothetical protein
MKDLVSHSQRREALAKILAAALMGLVKDPTGANLPADCWGQMTDKAEAVLFIATNGQTPYKQTDYQGPG